MEKIVYKDERKIKAVQDLFSTEDDYYNHYRKGIIKDINKNAKINSEYLLKDNIRDIDVSVLRGEFRESYKNANVAFFEPIYANGGSYFEDKYFYNYLRKKIFNSIDKYYGFRKKIIFSNINLISFVIGKQLKDEKIINLNKKHYFQKLDTFLKDYHFYWTLNQSIKDNKIYFGYFDIDDGKLEFSFSYIKIINSKKILTL